MIIELGHFTLILALVIATVQATLPLIGAARNDPAWMGIATPAALTQAAALTLSFAALTVAFVTSDFTVLNVVENSHSAKPLLYRVAGVWGNHEGSMLLWVLTLALFGALVAGFGRQLPPTLKARVLGVQGLVGVGFLLFILLTSNPFIRVDPPPLDGRDLNPLLQDPGLALHPPFLYFGYVGFSMAFSFAVAALLEGRVDAAWARWVRPWTLAAWAGLTIGIGLGSWWAYFELGWGGWWFWDPVENASLMPWLAGTALLHSAIVVEKRESLKAWTILLAILTFGLSLLGTFLVRSGVLTSVHAFAVDPARGVFILALLLLAVGGGLLLFALRAPVLRGGGMFAPISREGSLVLNNLLLTTATATVLIGTLYPLLMEAVDAGRVSVGPPFFLATFVPLTAPMVIAMVIGPLLAWKRGDLGGAMTRLAAAGGLTVLICLVAYWLEGGRSVLAIFGIALAAWAITGALAELAARIRLFAIPLGDSLKRAVGLPRSAWAMTIAHAGVGVAIAGMTASTAWESETIDVAEPGQVFTVGGIDVRFDGAEPIEGPNYAAYRGTMVIVDSGLTLHPERRWYPVAQMQTTEAAVRSTIWSDLYVVLGDPTEDGQWTVRMHHHPLVGWIWAGVIMMSIGGVIAMSDRRLRVGVPRRLAGHAAPAPAE